MSSTTTSLDHRSQRLDFTEDHGVVPGMGSWALGMLGLALIVAGDFASFNIALSRSFTGMGEVTVLLLTLAMTAAAVLLMFEAGRADARRRSRNTGRTGRAPVVTRILAWLLLGATAFTLRMAAPPEVVASSGFGSGAAGDGFGAAATTGGFGQAAEAAGGTTLLLGPMTWHGENLASALALLAIFVAGGVGSYFLGRESHNPLLTDVRRRRWAERRARGRLAAAQAEHDRVRSQAAHHGAAWDHYAKATRELEILSDLEHQLDLYDSAAGELAAADSTLGGIDREIAGVEAELASLAVEAQMARQQAAHTGARAKGLARVLIAQPAGEAAAMSGPTKGADR